MDGSPRSRASRAASTAAGFSPTVEGVLATACAVLLTGALVTAATLGIEAAALAGAVALYLVLLTVLGRDRMAAVTVMAAFFTAPFFKGLDPAASITPTDVLLGIAVLLFVPTVMARRLNLPMVYWLGLGLLVITGIIASAASYSPIGSLVNLMQWLAVLFGLALLYVLWRPSALWIRILLWSYVAGHMTSMVYALVVGPLDNDRYAGLTHHPNAFGEAGLIAAAIALYLLHEYQDLRLRMLVVAVGVASGASVLMGGSRAAFVVLAVLVVMVPIAERTAVWGFLGALAGGVVLAFLPFIVDLSGESSALGRLQGSGGAQAADQARESSNQVGWDMLRESPLIGNGYVIELFEVHNAYLEVAASAGVFALIGFLMVLFALARPLFGWHRHRRLCYMVWAYVGVAAALPSLWDRTSWVPMALAFLVAATPNDTEHPARDAEPSAAE